MKFKGRVVATRTRNPFVHVVANILIFVDVFVTKTCVEAEKAFQKAAPRLSQRFPMDVLELPVP